MRLVERIHLLDPTPGERILHHGVFWLVLFGWRLYLIRITFNVYSGFPNAYLVLLTITGTALIAAVYYLLTNLLWQWTMQRRWVLSVTGLLMTITLYTVLDAALEQWIIRSCADCMMVLKERQGHYYNLLQSGMINIVLKRLLSLGTPLTLILTLSIPLCIRLALRGWRSQVKALHLAKQNIELEFNFLKAQVNPHFLFNTMNNIYGLILKQDTVRSAEMVARLSGLLRYMLYETDAGFMPLNKEVLLLQDYIELEKVRLNDTAVRTRIETDAGDYRLPPLLLVPLLENAFKFCSDSPGAYISMSLSVQKGRLCCVLDNTVEPGRTGVVDRGIGLANFRKRLDLYYPGRHRYESDVKDGLYSVHLSIELL